MIPALGVCYYPEQWPQAIWRKDAERMFASGIRWVRIGEFAWSRIEPKPNQFEWGWLDKAIDVMGLAGLKCVLGTPTATPPRWVLDKHPDLLGLNSEGLARKFGSRRHYDFSHLGYRQESARICGILAERYAHHSALGFWQTDNEYGCHDTTLSYSEASLIGFRQWLAERYNDIETLNRAWGNVFWSMEYSDFADIELPNQTVTEANPAHRHDFRRYASEQVQIFNRIQIDAIRQHDPSTPILHNYMGRATDFDHFALGQDLDAASWDSYPLGFLEDRIDASEQTKLAYMRQGHPDFQAFHHDLYRAVGKGRWWVMEQQPGPVNWAPYNPAPLPGMVRLWTWEAIAHGAEVVSYFRWRQAPFAQEQMHAGLLRPDDQPSPALAEVEQIAAEINDYDEVTLPAEVAIVFDYESAWAWETQPQGASFDYFNLVFEQYQALRKLGLSIDFCGPKTTDFSNYRLLLIPGLMFWPAALKQSLESFKGVLLLGPRCGSKSEDFSIPDNLPPDCNDLMDIKVTQVESLRPGASIPLKTGGYVHHWREFLLSGEGVETCFSTEAGEPILERQGKVYYLGGWLDEMANQQMMQILCRDAECATVVMPDGVRIRRWGNLCVAVNYAAESRNIASLQSLATFATSELRPADVALGPSNRRINLN